MSQNEFDDELEDELDDEFDDELEDELDDEFDDHVDARPQENINIEKQEDLLLDENREDSKALEPLESQEKISDHKDSTSSSALENSPPTGPQLDEFEKNLQLEPQEIQDSEVRITPENIPLSIHVELDRIELSAKELISLKSGTHLELNKNLCDTVDLRLQGQIVAKGQIVKIGERIAVQIIEIHQ